MITLNEGLIEFLKRCSFDWVSRGLGLRYLIKVYQELQLFSWEEYDAISAAELGNTMKHLLISLDTWNSREYDSTDAKLMKLIGITRASTRGSIRLTVRSLLGSESGRNGDCIDILISINTILQRKNIKYKPLPPPEIVPF